MVLSIGKMPVYCRFNEMPVGCGMAYLGIWTAETQRITICGSKPNWRGRQTAAM
jgi:hypothetical protein